MNLLMIVLSLIIVPICLFIDSTLGLFNNLGWFMDTLLIGGPITWLNRKILEKSKKISDTQIKWNMGIITGINYNNMKKANKTFDKIYDTGKITGDRVYKILGKKKWYKIQAPYKEAWFHPGGSMIGVPLPWPYKGYKHKPGTRFYPYYKKDDKGNMIPVHK